MTGKFKHGHGDEIKLLRDEGPQGFASNLGCWHNISVVDEKTAQYLEMIRSRDDISCRWNGRR